MNLAAASLQKLYWRFFSLEHEFIEVDARDGSGVITPLVLAAKTQNARWK